MLVKHRTVFKNPRLTQAVSQTLKPSHYRQMIFTSAGGLLGLPAARIKTRKISSFRQEKKPLTYINSVGE